MIFSHNVHDSDSLHELMGEKARKLLELTEKTFPVPPFAVLTTIECARILHEDGTRDDVLLREYGDILRDAYPTVLRFAVRSAAKNEDGKTHAHAGEFSTYLHVLPSELEIYIAQVLTDAQEKQGVSPSNFSLIIQECIEEPEYGGVLFTRSPRGGCEMVVEYNRGEGVGVVHGSHVVRESWYGEGEHATHPPRVRVRLPQFRSLQAYGSALERLYAFPQDIEWIYRKGKYAILQTRPITSITDGSWQGIQLADAVRAKEPTRYLKKTALTETFPRPRPFTFSFLASLYSPSGPISRAYAEVGISYTAVDTLFTQVGNELFIDMESELKSIFPAFGYARSRQGEYGWESWRGLPQTVKNWYALARIRPDEHAYTTLKEKLDAYLVSPLETESLERCLDRIREQYALVFLITLYGEVATQSLLRMLGTERHLLASLLMAGEHEAYPPYVETYRDILRGNSINFDDTSTFIFSSQASSVASPQEMRATLPPHRAKLLRTPMLRARLFSELRERARLLSVRLRTHGEDMLMREGKERFPHNPELVWYATETELRTDTYDLEVLEERTRMYGAYNTVSAPAVIAPFVPMVIQESVGVSPGVGEGVVVSQEDLSLSSEHSRTYILHTRTLSPDIPQYFKKVVGVIADEGGMLSHAAIMAREMGIPVVVSPRAQSYREKPVRIDGTSGEIVVLPS